MTSVTLGRGRGRRRINSQGLAIAVISHCLFDNAFRSCFDRFPVLYDEPVAAELEQRVHRTSERPFIFDH